MNINIADYCSPRTKKCVQKDNDLDETINNSPQRDENDENESPNTMNQSISSDANSSQSSNSSESSAITSTVSIRTPQAQNVSTENISINSATKSKRSKNNGKVYNKSEIKNCIFKLWIDLNIHSWSTFLRRKTLKDLLRATADVPDDFEFPSCDDMEKLFNHHVTKMKEEQDNAKYIPIMYYKAIADAGYLSCVALGITEDQHYVHVSSIQCKSVDRNITKSVSSLQLMIDALNARFAANESQPKSVMSVIVDTNLKFEKYFENFWKCDVIWHPIFLLDVLLEYDPPCTHRSELLQIDKAIESFNNLKTKFTRSETFYLSDFVEDLLNVQIEIESMSGAITKFYLESIDNFLTPIVLASNVLDSSHIGAIFMNDGLEQGSAPSKLKTSYQLRERVFEFFRERLQEEWDIFVDYFSRRGIFSLSFEKKLNENVEVFWKTFNIQCPKLHKIAREISRIPVLPELKHNEILENINLDLGEDKKSDLIALFKHVRTHQLVSRKM